MPNLLESEIEQLRARLSRLESSRPRGRINLIGAARYIGKSEETLRRMHERGEGPPRARIGARGWSYSYDDLDRWLAARSEHAA
jgi:hypothetical protein